MLAQPWLHGGGVVFHGGQPYTQQVRRFMQLNSIRRVGPAGSAGNLAQQEQDIFFCGRVFAPRRLIASLLNEMANIGSQQASARIEPLAAFQTETIDNVQQCKQEQGVGADGAQTCTGYHIHDLSCRMSWIPLPSLRVLPFYITLHY